MKSLHESACHNAEAYHEYPDTEAVYEFTLGGLESLINEVISQRLGEPYGYLHFTKQFEHRFTRLKPNGELYPHVGEVTPLYALNIES